MRIGSTTQRGLGAVALTTTLVLLSLLLAACWADSHTAHSDGRPHTADSLTAAHGPAHQCHHHSDRSPRSDLLDQAFPRQHDRAGHLATTQSPPADVSGGTQVLKGHHAGPPPNTGGPPRPGRALLIDLGIARN